MTMQLRWLASQSASGLHAVAALLAGHSLVDSEWTSTLTTPAQMFFDELQALAVPAKPLLAHLAALAAEIDNNRQLAQLALQKTIGPTTDRTVNHVAGCIGSIEAAIQRAFPRLLDELQLRFGPLREQWEAYGPGLLTQIGWLTDERLLAESADIVLVQPVLGGAAVAQLLYNSVRFEAVLVNPVAPLPEFLRLAWALGQLQCDLPIFSESIPRDRLPAVVELALLPPTLEAASRLDFGVVDEARIALAMQTWHLPSDVEPAVLLGWWQTCLDTQPRWDVALQALDQLTAPGTS